ncbi:MFS transporter [Pyxidicoccus parkwayensis]|uniref:MFS transporter n=1 Tax=Pyxidicoccus parkwayensis TaxID=2813578 RepID=A0ABX7P5F6_9BACT|nr:MFS transporter [Pyxidicoccus parkwaysis]QSQ25682.1 MFS transporter [Pyxidicoccus parkwaysis]
MTDTFRLRELTLMASSMIAIIGTTAIAASLPHMSEAYADVPNSRFLVSVVLTLPALSVALCGPFIGMAIDSWGRKRIFILSLLIYGLSGAAGSVLPSLPAILVSRLVLGVAVSGITTCSTALLADYAEERKLGNLMGRQSLFMSLGNVVFVSLGGVLADHHWRLPFLLYAVAFVVLPGVVFTITEPRVARAAQPSVSVATVEVVPVRRTVLVYALGFVNMVVYFMVPVYLPFHLRSFPGNSSARAGGLLAVVGLSWAVSSSMYHRVRRHLSFEQVAFVALALMGIAYLMIARAMGYALLIPALVIIGAGLGVFVPNLNAWLLSFAPTTMKGRMIGGLVFFVFLGQFFSPIFTRPLRDTAGISASYFAGGALLLLLSLGTMAGGRRAMPMRLSAERDLK